MNEVCAELRGICKSFGPVRANNNIDLVVRTGEIHALLGENGSGKSTLMNILSGVYTPDSGKILLDGKEVVFHSPNDSIEAGVGMIYQHFKLVDVFTAKENIVSGNKGSMFLSGKRDTKDIAALADKYGLKVDPDKKVYNMSVSEKQTVEILKVLYRGSKLLILDEPTAVLTPKEIRVLFGILKNMKAAGCAIIIITHKLGEVMEISDRVTVLRKGESIRSMPTSETGPRELTDLMVGRPVSLEIERAEVEPEKRKPLLSIKNLTVLGGDKHRAVNDMSFDLEAGEILGVAGVAGSGQKELCETIAGIDRAVEGEIIFKGDDITHMSPREIIRRGISMSFVPEDRLGVGLVGGMNIIDNVLLKTYQNMPGITVNRKVGKETAEGIIERFDIATPGPYHVVKKLSGGNIQKVLLGRELLLNPELLITAYPVRGLDIGASYNIYDILNEQKKKGVGILFIGEDIDVLLGLSDRIMVMYNGRISGILDAKNTTKEEVGMLMLGQTLDGKKIEAVYDHDGKESAQ